MKKYLLFVSILACTSVQANALTVDSIVNAHNNGSLHKVTSTLEHLQSVISESKAEYQKCVSAGLVCSRSFDEIDKNYAELINEIWRVQNTLRDRLDAIVEAAKPGILSQSETLFEEYKTVSKALQGANELLLKAYEDFRAEIKQL